MTVGEAEAHLEASYQSKKPGAHTWERPLLQTGPWLSCCGYHAHCFYNHCKIWCQNWKKNDIFPLLTCKLPSVSSTGKALKKTVRESVYITHHLQLKQQSDEQAKQLWTWENRDTLSGTPRLLPAESSSGLHLVFSHLEATCLSSEEFASDGLLPTMW